jgi:hypothetical protein
MMIENARPLFPRNVTGTPLPSLIYLLTTYLTSFLVKGILLAGLCFAFIINGFFFTIIALLIWIPSWIYESSVKLLGTTNGTPQSQQPDTSITVYRENDISDFELDEVDYPMIDIETTMSPRSPRACRRGLGVSYYRKCHYR